MNLSKKPNKTLQRTLVPRTAEFGRYRAKMNKAYEKLKAITDDVYAQRREKWADDAIQILRHEGIKLRQDDGMLRQTNFSIPTSLADAFVLGLRYEKKDGTHAEDHFLFQKGKQIECCYKRKLEKKLKGRKKETQK